VAVLVRRRTRNVSLLVVLWVLIGIVVAAERGYITASLLRVLVSAVLAILLWPLVLLGINLHV
jgi:predicted PurR-regulated permease PerM